MLPPSSVLSPEIIAQASESCVSFLKRVGLLSVFAPPLID